MIVRISTEGQYELDGEAAEQVNQLDNDALQACAADDEARFQETYARLLDAVRAGGRALSADELSGSDLILPPPDVSLHEAKAEFTGEGLIPG